jgi:tetratricopeptide (TPR) repeat protein
LSLENQKSAALSDPGAEVVDRLTSFWQRSGRIVLGVLLVIVVAGVGGYLYMRNRASTEDQAAGKLAEANAMFWQGDYPRALEAAKQVYTQYGSTPSGRDAHRLAGDGAFWLGDHKTAIDEYRTFLKGHPSDLLADAARRSLGYALENGKQFKEAAAEYDLLVGKFDRESSGEMLAASARCLAAAGDKAEAAKRLQRLLDEFGDTSFAQRAQADLAGLTATAH